MNDPREIIAKGLLDWWHVNHDYPTIGPAEGADRILAALSEAGYTICRPGLSAPSIFVPVELGENP